MKYVFDVIEALREQRGYTLKELAERASIKYTTLASMMANNPQTIARNTLVNIADVFGVKWYELLGESHGFGEFMDKKSRNINGIRLKTYLQENDYDEAIRMVMGDDISDKNEKHYEEVRIPVIKYRQVGVISTSALKKHFRASINTVLDRLSDEGVMEVMRHVLDIAMDPKYYVSTDSEKKEGTGWQEEEQ